MNCFFLHSFKRTQSLCACTSLRSAHSSNSSMIAGTRRFASFFAGKKIHTPHSPGCPSPTDSEVKRKAPSSGARSQLLSTEPFISMRSCVFTRSRVFSVQSRPEDFKTTYTWGQGVTWDRPFRGGRRGGEDSFSRLLLLTLVFSFSDRSRCGGSESHTTHVSVEVLHCFIHASSVVLRRCRSPPSELSDGEDVVAQTSHDSQNV